MNVTPPSLPPSPRQVRRMFAAVGNKVVGLRRVSVGGLALGDLPEAEWRFLTPQDLEAVFGGPSTEDIFSGAGAAGGGSSGSSSSGGVVERDGGAAASTSGRGGAGAGAAARRAEVEDDEEEEQEAGERLTKKEKKKGRKEDVRAAKRAARSGPAAQGEGEETEEEDLDGVADVELLEFGEDEEDELEAAAAARRAAAAGGRRPRKPRRATVRQGVVIDGKGQGVEEEGLGLEAAYEGGAEDVVLSSGAGGGVRKYKDDARWRRRRDALKELLPNKQ